VRPLVRPQIDSSGSRREDDAELSNEEVQREAGRRQRDRQRQPRTRHRELHDPVHLRELADDGQHRLPRAHQDSGGTVEERHQERAAGLFAGQHRLHLFRRKIWCQCWLILARFSLEKPSSRLILFYNRSLYNR
jgi:hypothetical protein